MRETNPIRASWRPDVGATLTLWIVDADAETVEVWRPEAKEAELVRDVLTWRVAAEAFDVRLREVFAPPTAPPPTS